MTIKLLMFLLSLAYALDVLLTHRRLRVKHTWAQQGAFAILLTICGYIAFNVAIIQSGSELINPALMNVAAGGVALIIFRKEIKGKPILWVSALGALGIIGIVFGLKWTHESLHDPSSTIEVIYDLLVISSVALWALIEKPLGLQRTVIRRFDIVLHACMACLVTSRILVHWHTGWSILGFLPALIAVAGYWLFNVSIRMAQKQQASTRATNIAMNFIGGGVITVIALISGDDLYINSGLPIGTIAIVCIVFFLGRAYRSLAPHGLSPIVVAGIYDGLLILAPLAMWLIYGQKFLLLDLAITFGFITVMTTRVLLYRRELVRIATQV